MKHIKKVKPASTDGSKSQSTSTTTEPRPIKHVRGCIPVDGN